MTRIRRIAVLLAVAIAIAAGLAGPHPAPTAQAAATVSLNGTVVDGSGHGWPLNATVYVFDAGSESPSNSSLRLQSSNPAVSTATQ